MRRWTRKLCILAVLGGFLFGGIKLYQGLAGVADAYLSNLDEKVNVVRAGSNKSHIEEEFTPPDEVKPDTEYEKVVTVKNDTDTDCYVRVIAETWDSAVHVTMDVNTKDWSEKGEDGYYYYQHILGPGEETEPIIRAVRTHDEAVPFEVIVYEETVQAAGYHSPIEAFASIKGK